MKVSGKLLRQLAQLSQTERTVLSAYLNLRNGWTVARQFLEREARKLSPLLTTQEKDSFKTSFSLLFDYLDEKQADNFQGPGLAFFADLGADFTSGVELTIAPEPLLAVDDEAIVHPLALQLDEYEPIGVIMIDASSVRILIAAGQVLADMDVFRKKIHHLSKVGGWSQMRYQRRRAKEIQQLSKEVIKNATEIFKEEGVKRILIAGRKRMITALQQEFPNAWQDKVIATIAWDLNAPDDEFLQKIKPILEKTEREQEEDLLKCLAAELRRGGLAVAGVESSMNALKRGQVDTLLISEGLDAKTTEALTSLAADTSAYIEFVPRLNPAITEIGGVGAFLRFKTAY